MLHNHSIRLSHAIRRQSKVLALGMVSFACLATVNPVKSAVLDHERFRSAVERFNAHDTEHFTNTIPNAGAWDFLQANIPLFECPDKDVELTYLFRWWAFRKHLRQTPEGWVVTEFLPSVPWAGKNNTISCGAGHHISDARWLKDPTYIHDYSRFWFRNENGIRPRTYSFWAASAILNWCLVSGDLKPAQELLPALVANYEAWERERYDDAMGLFWQLADKDGMEGAIGGHGFRPTINAYMYGDAVAIARIADSAAQGALAELYRRKAAALKKRVQERLWNPEHEFFEVHEGIGSLGLLGWRINGDIELTREARPTASVPASAASLSSLLKATEPRKSWDWANPHLKFEDAPGKYRMGTEEWVQYDLSRPTSVTSLQVYLLGGHLMDVPQSVRVLHRVNGDWKEVKNVHGRVEAKDRWNTLTFPAVVTDGVRLEFRLRGYDRSQLGLRNVRELLGYVPWCFDLPDPQYAVAWRQLTDAQGFAAPYGLTTAEQRHPEFKIRYDGHQCLWNGPVWPFATSQTLTALANLLNGPEQSIVDKRAYFDALSVYARTQRMTLPNGAIVPWIDENLNPYTGDWIARTCLLNWEKTAPEILTTKGNSAHRGKDYNHSTFADLIISGLVGLRPELGERVVVNPLLPDKTWEWFCLDNVTYHGRKLTILWDLTGKKYGKGRGLRVLCDGEEIASAETLRRIEGRLPTQRAFTPAPALKLGP